MRNHKSINQKGHSQPLEKKGSSDVTFSLLAPSSPTGRFPLTLIAVLGQESLTQNDTYPCWSTASQVVAAVTDLTTGGQSHDCGGPSKITVPLPAAHQGAQRVHQVHTAMNANRSGKAKPIPADEGSACASPALFHTGRCGTHHGRLDCHLQTNSSRSAAPAQLTYHEMSIYPEGKSTLLPECDLTVTTVRIQALCRPTPVT